MSQAEIQAIQAELARRAEISAIEAELARRQAQPAPQQPGAITPDARDTAPGTTPEEAASLPEGLIYNDETGGYIDTALSAQRMNPIQRGLATALSGLPFGIGEGMDEMIGRADAAISGRRPEIAQETFRQADQQFNEANPVLAPTLEIGAGVAGASFPIAKGLQVALRAPGVLGKTAAGSALATAGGAVEGSLSGYARGRGRRDRRQQAAQDAVIGAGVGAAAGPFGMALGWTFKQAASAFRRTDVKTIANVFGVNRRTAKVIKDAIANDDLDAAEAALRRAGPNARLAEGGEGVASVLDAAAQSGGEALSTTRQAVGQRVNEAATNLTPRLNSILGVPEGRRAALRNIAQSSAPERSRLYTAAFRRPINYGTGEAGEAVLATLDRVPDRHKTRAIQRANELMQIEGDDVRQILIGENGALAELPNTKQLHFIKRALNDLVEEGRDSVTGEMSPDAMSISGLARDLTKAIGDANPAYRAASKRGGDAIAERHAYNTAFSMFRRNVTLEDVTDAMVSQDARQAAKMGLRQQIDDTLGRVRSIMSGPMDDTQARQAGELIRMFSSDDAKKKVTAILGRRDAVRFYREWDGVRSALQMQARLNTNSRTAIRGAIQGEIQDSAVNPVLRNAREGQVLGTAQAALGEALGGTAANAEARSQMFAQIADVLSNTRGPEAQRALRLVRQAIDGQTLTDAQLRLIDETMRTASTATGHEYTTQQLTR